MPNGEALQYSCHGACDENHPFNAVSRRYAQLPTANLHVELTFSNDELAIVRDPFVPFPTGLLVVGTV